MGILDGKVAVITGSGQGLGEGTAHAMSKDGACVALWGRTYEKVKRVADDINAEGGHALAVKCDVSIYSEVEEALKKTIEEFGKLDILAANHFAFVPYMPFVDTPEENFTYAFNNNFLGTVNCMKACFPYLKESGNGKVITYSSNSETTGSKMMSAYAASKAAIRGLTKVVANEWGQYNINVNCILPCGDSPAWTSTKDFRTKEQLDATMAGFTLHRDDYSIGDPMEDVGKAVVFLASPYSNWITGRSILVDGGVGYFR